MEGAADAEPVVQDLQLGRSRRAGGEGERETVRRRPRASTHTSKSTCPEEPTPRSCPRAGAEADPRVPGAPWSARPPRHSSSCVCGPGTKRKREKLILDRGLSPRAIDGTSWAVSKRNSSAHNMINSRSTPRCCDTHGLVPRGAPGGTRPTRPALDSLMETSPNLARTTDNLQSGPWPGPPTGRPWPHTPRGLDPGGGSEAGPLSAPALGPCLPPAAVRAARTWPAHVLGAMLHPGTCQMPGDGLATRSARSWGAWGAQGAQGACGPTARRSSRTVTPGPLQPAVHTACLLMCYFLPQQTAKGRRSLGNCLDLCSHREEG